MKPPHRRPLLAANWKMNLLHRDAEAYCQSLLVGLGLSGADVDPQRAAALRVDVVLFPPFVLIPAVVAALRRTSIGCGSQDVHPQPQGAFTGDISAAQLADAGCSWVICGHSERRRDHGENDQQVGQKALAARAAGLVPVICLGETRDQRRAGQTMAVLATQLAAALADSPSTFEIAYEPIWAIGTGETATPEVAQEAHAFLRQELVRLVGAERATATRLLYGGSATPDNVTQLYAQPDIDGFLVGGASLDARKFLAMIHACSRLAAVHPA